jgi:hypothetical protein
MVGACGGNFTITHSAPVTILILFIRLTQVRLLKVNDFCFVDDGMETITLIRISADELFKPFRLNEDSFPIHQVRFHLIFKNEKSIQNQSPFNSVIRSLILIGVA